MNPDRVLTVNEYYDGPRLGVAELNGVPYIYEAEFDHSTDEYGDTYFLSPIDPELLALVLEDWAIWCRWDAAHKRGGSNACVARCGLPLHPQLRKLSASQRTDAIGPMKRHFAPFHISPTLR